jgi:hypothetical protein
LRPRDHRQHWDDQKDFQSYLIEGADLLTAWFNKLPDDNFSVVAVEEAFVFEIDGMPLPIVGAIDLVEEDYSGTIIITDHKTTGRAYSIDEIDQKTMWSSRYLRVLLSLFQTKVPSLYRRFGSNVIWLRQLRHRDGL